MTQSPSHGTPKDPGQSLPGLWSTARKSRRDKVREEIAANRRGEYLVPTWVLAMVLLVMVATIAGLIIYANLR